MDPLSIIYVKSFVELYLSEYKERELNIVEIGSCVIPGQEVIGTFRKFFDNPRWKYTGVDIESGLNVDIVLSDPYRWIELKDDFADVVISGATFEHVEFPWEVIKEVRRIIKPGGLFCLIVPSSGPEHKHPYDCWRIFPDGVRALAKWGGLEVVEVFQAVGILPWQHTFAVLTKTSPDGSRTHQNKAAGFSAYISAASLPLREDHILTPDYFIISSDMLVEAGRIKQAEEHIGIGLRLYPDNDKLKRKALEIYRLNKSFQKGMGVVLSLVNFPSSEKTKDLIAISNFVSDLTKHMKTQLKTREMVVILNNFFKALSLECRRLVNDNLYQIHLLSSFSEDIGFWLLCEECWSKIASLNLDQGEHIRAMLMWAVMPRGYGFTEISQRRFDEILDYQLKNNIINRTTIIQHLIYKMNYKTYVEIGVERGLNFFQIKCPLKIGVDIKFKIPGGFENTENQRFYETSSDDFFSNPPEDIVKNGIDIALIDGSHTYKQSLKDLMNCLKYLNENGTIVLHDCIPTSESCAAPTFEDAKRYPDFQGAWSGEVYKTIVNIRRNSAIFCAVVDCDFGVGILRRGKAESVLDMSDEEIEKLNFHDLMANKARLLNIKTKEWFMEFLKSL